MENTVENQQNGNGNLERRVEHILISKTKLLYGVVAIVVPPMIAVICFFYNIQVNIALIKQNHEAHMQTALEKIAALEDEQKDLMKEIKLDHDAIIKLQTQMEK